MDVLGAPLDSPMTGTLILASESIIPNATLTIELMLVSSLRQDRLSVFHIVHFPESTSCA